MTETGICAQLCLGSEKMGLLQMWIAALIGASAALVSVLFKVIFRKPTDRKQAGKLGIFSLSDIGTILLIGEPSEGQMIVLHVFRQSGNWERSIECGGREPAINEVKKLFNRLDEDQVRLWENSVLSVDVRRLFGSFKGRNEGKKIWGCKLEVVPIR